jgi:membrane-bound lytic murein transglycosylase B
VRGREYLVRAAVALVAVGALAGGVVGVRAATTTTDDASVAAALPPVAVDGSVALDAVTSTDQIAAVLPAASGLPPQQVGSVVPSQPVADATPGSPYAAWAARVAPVTGIPQRALEAYASAQATVAAVQPQCHLSWATLAGLANIESRHGTYQGRTLGADGRSTPPIIGIPLDGGPNVQAIPDTDRGVLDGDTTWDRAVGPFQFIPTTWARWGTDANGDGKADPQNIDDAALTAGRYLCADGKDLATGDGWSRAVLSYNNSAQYLHDVFDGADRYARQSAGVS